MHILTLINQDNCAVGINYWKNQYYKIKSVPSDTQ